MSSEYILERLYRRSSFDLCVVFCLVGSWMTDHEGFLLELYSFAYNAPFGIRSRRICGSSQET